ncbi:MAG: DUF2330 domain-containing protein, partial [Patescibacteria group bacterium]
TGIFLTNEFTEIAPLGVKAAIFHDGREETIIASPSFTFNPLVEWNFLWLIATPTEPEVTLINTDVFPELERLLGRKPLESGKLLTKPVNIFEYQVFGPDVSLDAIEQLVHEKGYYFPKALRPVLDGYHAKKWSFVIADVNGVHSQRSAVDSLTISGMHILPIKLKFKTDRIVYPMKLSSVETDLDSQAVPLSFPYGSTSESITGIKDPKLDVILSKQSPRKYPSVPRGFSNYKTELLVFYTSEISAKDFTTVATKQVDGRKIPKNSWNNFYLDLPKEQFTISDLISYRPLATLDDVTIDQAMQNPLLAALEGASNFNILSTVGIIMLFIFGIIIWEKMPFTPRVRLIVYLLCVCVLFGAAFLYNKFYVVHSQQVIPAASETIYIRSASDSFSPNIIHAKVGKLLTIHVASVDGPHTFTIDELGVNVSTALGTTMVNITPEKKGSFEFYCTLPGHREAGQRGTIIVD